MIDALWITLLGMGITFLAILLLWGMMAGLTALPFKDSDSPEPGDAVDENLRAKAAAVAVAIALAEQEFSSARPLPAPPTAIVSAWQLSTTATLATHSSPLHQGEGERLKSNMKYNVKIGEKEFEVEIEDINKRPIIARVEGEEFAVIPENGKKAAVNRPETSASAAFLAGTSSTVLSATKLFSPLQFLTESLKKISSIGFLAE